MAINKTKEDSLHALIQTLTKGERKKIKLQSKGYSSDKNYIKLFDLLSDMPTYQHQKIEKKFDDDFIKRLAAEKNYLYNKIIEILLGDKKDYKIIIRNKLNECNILLKRRLFKKCFSVIKKYKKLAISNKDYTSVLAFLDMEITACIGSSNKKELERALEEQKHYILVSNRVNLFILNCQTFSLQAFKMGVLRDKTSIKKLHNILQKMDEYAVESELPFDQLLHYFNSHGLYNLYIANYEGAYCFFSKVTALIESNLQEEYAMKYILATNNFILSCLFLGKEEEHRNTLAKMEQIIEAFNISDVLISNQFIERVSFHKVLYLLFKHSYKEADHTYTKLISELSTADGIRQDNLDLDNYLMAYAKFGQGSYAEAKSWLNNLLNKPEKAVMPITLRYSKLLNLLCFIDQKDYEYAEYALANVIHFNKINGFLEQFEECLFDYLTSVIKGNTKKQAEQIKRLEEYIHRNPNVRFSMLPYINILVWIDSRKAGLTYADYIKQHLN